MSRSMMTHEASLEGDGFRFTLRASRYERPDNEDDDYYDRNWVYGEVEMETSRGGRFVAKKEVSFLAGDLALFVEQLRVLDRTLSGEALLRHLEAEFDVNVRLDAGLGTLSAVVTAHVQAELSVEKVAINQSYIRLALPAFEALAQAFPMRGAAR
jgi:hypothetical protein